MAIVASVAGAVLISIVLGWVRDHRAIVVSADDPVVVAINRCLVDRLYFACRESSARRLSLRRQRL